MPETYLHYVKPGPKALCGFRLRRKDHESLRETVARTTDEVTCPACLLLLRPPVASRHLARCRCDECVYGRVGISRAEDY